MTKNTATLSGLLLLSLHAFSQNENWDVYMARYEKGAGSTVFNVSLKDSAPIKGYPFLLKTGVKAKDCPQGGLVSGTELDMLYSISDKMKSIIDAELKNREAGTFSYQCERTDYYYVADTNGLRTKLAVAYKTFYPQYEYTIEIRVDPEWDAYLKFLYPNEEIREYMENEKVIYNLTKAGDDLSKPRQTDHWLYFNNEADRNAFISYALKENFKIESRKTLDKGSRPFQLQISRTDKVDMSSITEITGELRKKAKELNGEYDGWETFVIKNK